MFYYYQIVNQPHDRIIKERMLYGDAYVALASLRCGVVGDNNAHTAYTSQWPAGLAVVAIHHLSVVLYPDLSFSPVIIHGVRCVCCGRVKWPTPLLPPRPFR